MPVAPSRSSAQPASLLDLEPDLAVGLPPEARQAARRKTIVPTVAVRPGPFDPSTIGGLDGQVRGFLITQGLLVRELLLAGGVASDLLGAGDFGGLDRADDALVPARVRWAVCSPARIAIVDDAVLGVLEQSPSIAGRLMLRAGAQASRLAVLRGISQLPRVEQRLLALFWFLAERWGRIAADGVVVPIALTHETLGRMVGARRPTVSLALKELSAQGRIARRLDGSWILDRDGRDLLTPSSEPGPPDVALLAVGTAA